LAIGADYPVLIDAACLRYWQRAQFRARARRCHIPFLILDCQAPLPLLQQRLANRAEHGSDTSDATPEVLQRQIAETDPLTPAERKVSLALDASGDLASGLTAVGQRLAKSLAKKR
jgi:uncharacterized protein